MYYIKIKSENNKLIWDIKGTNTEIDYMIYLLCGAEDIGEFTRDFKECNAPIFKNQIEIDKNLDVNIEIVRKEIKRIEGRDVKEALNILCQSIVNKIKKEKDYTLDAYKIALSMFIFGIREKPE